MKKIYSIIAIASMVIIYACRKDSKEAIGITASESSPISLTIKDAKDYMAASTNYAPVTTTYNTNSVKQQSLDATTPDRNGVIVWSKAHIYKNGRFEVIECPILFDKKRVPFYKAPGQTQSKSDSLVVQAAFSRIAIFRDTATKKINKKVVTYIPDRATVISSGYDISGNYLNQFSSKFNGFVEIQNWDNSKTVVYRISNGKRAGKYRVTKLQSDPNDKATFSTGVKTSGNIICDGYLFEWDEVVSISAETGMAYDNNIIHHSDWIEFCYDDGSSPDPDPDPTPDPNGPGGGGSGGDGGGTTTPTTPPDEEKTITTDKTFTVTADQDELDEYVEDENSIGYTSPNNGSGPRLYMPLEYLYHVIIVSGEQTGVVKSVDMLPIVAHPANITYLNPDGTQVTRNVTIFQGPRNYVASVHSVECSWQGSAYLRYTWSFTSGRTTSKNLDWTVPVTF